MLDNHSHAVLQFSGGKDSLATLYLARPFLDRITVMFGDTGGTYPHLVQFVTDTCAKLGAELLLVEPPMPVAEYTEAYGLPSDIVPAWTTHGMAEMLSDKPRQLLQSPMSCCSRMLLEPLYRAVLKTGAKLVIRGAKKTDKRVGVPPGFVDAIGITYTSPIWDWSDDEVFAYLKKEGAELAPHYADVKDSLDCWICTGHMPYSDAAKKLAYTKTNYPELWPILQERLNRVAATVKTETERSLSPMADHLQ